MLLLEMPVDRVVTSGDCELSCG